MPEMLMTIDLSRRAESILKETAAITEMQKNLELVGLDVERLFNTFCKKLDPTKGTSDYVLLKLYLDFLAIDPYYKFLCEPCPARKEMYEAALREKIEIKRQMEKVIRENTTPYA